MRNQTKSMEPLDAATGGEFRIRWHPLDSPEPVFDLLDCGPRNRFTIMTTYGPVIVHNCSENIVQCLARIIVGEQMLTIERNKDYQRMGAELVMMTHDETVSHHLRTHDKEIKEIIIDAFTTPPSWWPDLPVNCDTDAAVRYSK